MGAPTAVVGFSVGGVRVDPPLVLAPMEDVTNVAFRRIAKRIARPGLVFTEFVSSMAVHYNVERTLPKLRIHPDERPVAVQIFGGDPDVMAESARLADAMGADIVDVNMGCWVPKVCRTGSGAALLKDPELAERIVRAVVRAVKIPVSVKVRAGWDYSLFAAPELAVRFQDAGVSMLTLHARFAKQGFEGEADWRLIERLRDCLAIPLVGNGDVRTPEDAIRMLRETGCDGVMVGRAAISNPWALDRIRAGLVGDPIPPEPSIRERVTVAVEHAEAMVAAACGFDEYGDAVDALGGIPEDTERRALRSMRGQLPLYIKSVPHAARHRAALSTVSNLEGLRTILDDLV